MGAIDIEIIAINNTGSSAWVYDLGIELLSFSQRNLTDEFKENDIATSDDLKALVIAGTIVLNDGTKDLVMAEAMDVFDEVIGLELTETIEASGVGPSGVSKAYVDERDQNILNESVAYTNSASADILFYDHPNLSTLVHNLGKNRYVEYIRTNGRVTSVIYWTDSGKTQKIREENYVYSGGLINQMILKQYDNLGNLMKTETSTITRTGGLISSENIGVS